MMMMIIIEKKLQKHICLNWIKGINNIIKKICKNPSWKVKKRRIKNEKMKIKN